MKWGMLWRGRFEPVKWMDERRGIDARSETSEEELQHGTEMTFGGKETRAPSFSRCINFSGMQVINQSDWYPFPNVIDYLTSPLHPLFAASSAAAAESAVDPLRTYQEGGEDWLASSSSLVSREQLIILFSSVAIFTEEHDGRKGKRKGAHHHLSFPGPIRLLSRSVSVSFLPSPSCYEWIDGWWIKMMARWTCWSFWWWWCSSTRPSCHPSSFWLSSSWFLFIFRSIILFFFVGLILLIRPKYFCVVDCNFLWLLSLCITFCCCTSWQQTSADCR